MLANNEIHTLTNQYMSNFFHNKFDDLQTMLAPNVHLEHVRPNGPLDGEKTTKDGAEEVATLFKEKCFDITSKYQIHDLKITVVGNRADFHLKIDEDKNDQRFQMVNKTQLIFDAATKQITHMYLHTSKIEIPSLKPESTVDKLSIKVFGLIKEYLSIFQDLDEDRLKHCFSKSIRLEDGKSTKGRKDVIKRIKKNFFDVVLTFTIQEMDYSLLGHTVLLRFKASKQLANKSYTVISNQEMTVKQGDNDLVFDKIKIKEQKYKLESYS